MKTMRIGERRIGGSSPCFIIAEISCNHNQSMEKALALIEEAARAGADAVKFQTYTPDTLTLNSHKRHFRINETIWKGKRLYDLYKEAYTPWEWFPELKLKAEKKGLVFFSTAYDETSVDFLERLRVPCYKVASFEINHIPLLKKIGKTRKPVILSSGVATLSDLKLAVSTLRKAGTKEIAILKCTSAYPAPYEEMNLRTIPDIARRFNVVAGLSDHTLGTAVPVAAVALGAKIIEKHFIHSRKDGGPDSAFSSEPQEFAEMVREVRKVERMGRRESALFLSKIPEFSVVGGKPTYNPTKKAKEHRFLMRSIFVSANVKKGERFTRENIKIVRPAYGLHPKHYERILGKKAARDIEEGTPLSFSMVAK
ncbi:MAG: pseudaminic acid synthase [Candidatus Micrarchaeota archaeon]|nr:pseudaminic acid synthase [Candidatus Micrarchaeota archaeon]